MGRYRWIILIIILIAALYLVNFSSSEYNKRGMIYNVNSNDYTETAASTLSSINKGVAVDSLSVINTTPVTDFIAVVKMQLNQGNQSIFMVFELYNGQLFLTNYSVSPFTETDFAHESDIVSQIITASYNMSQV